LRKFNQNRKNPNPPWPNKQSVVVVPKGSNAAAVGMSEKKLYEVPEKSIPTVAAVSPGNPQTENNVFDTENEREMRRDPIMGDVTLGGRNAGSVNMSSVIPNMGGTAMNTQIPNFCGNISVNGYLCNQLGKYVKLEFLFGENTHMEKIGKLLEVGRDFVAIEENGTNNVIVCATNKIKFINIYNY